MRHGFRGTRQGTVEEPEQGAFEPGVAEMADEQHRGQAEEGDPDDGPAKLREIENEGVADQLDDDGVREVDRVRPVAHGDERGGEADEFRAFELEQAEQEEGGAGAIE